MKRKLLLGILFCIMVLPGFTQTASYNNWIFGTYLWFNFNGGAPVDISGAPTKLKSQEACGSISNNAGSMLMYSDGVNLWDGTNTLRTNTLMGAESGAQGVMIIPYPGTTTKFYIFTGSVDPGSGGIGQPNKGVNYTVVDISGGVWTYTAWVNLVSATTATEHLTAVSDGVGGFWIVSHLNTNGAGGGDNRIVSFHFNAAGAMDAGPVLSSAGGASIVKWIGTAKSNSCGNKIAFTHYDAGTVELYAFDNSVGGGTSGQVTSLLKSFPTAHAYGIEFSPNDQFLYWTNLGGNQMYQFDITNNGNPAGSGTAYTNAAWKSNNELSEMAQLQLGPDGLIYVSESSNGGQATLYVGAITSPNTSGAGATYNGKQITVSTTNGLDGFPFRGLPDYYRSLVVSSSLAVSPGTGTYCSATNIPLSYTFAGAAASQTWTVTPGVLGTDYTYTTGNGGTPNPTINFTTNGTYKIKLVVTDNCAHNYPDSITVTIVSPKVPAGAISCAGNTITLTATGAVPADYPNYVWYDAAAGGHVLGVGSPVTLNYANTASAPASVWVEVAASTSTTSSGSNTIGMTNAGLSWAASASTPVGSVPVSAPVPFTVLASTLTLNSFVVQTWSTTGNFTLTIQNSSAVTVFQQTYTVPTSGVPFTVNINNTFPTGTYNMSVTGSTLQWYGGNWAGGTNAGQITLPTLASYSGEYPFANFSYNYTNYSVTPTCSQEVQVNRICTLPVELISFTGQPVNNTIVTDWITTSEINNDYFEIQRSSDGINFVTIGTVKGHGNSNTVNEYKFSDAHPNNGTNYYRLVQHDFNGNLSYSSIIKVFTGTNAASFTVSPNPSTESFNINFQDISGGEFTVLNVLGQTLTSKTIETGTEKISVGTELSKGAYVLRFSGTNGVYTQLVIKE
jgi:hypothetical protein